MPSPFFAAIKRHPASPVLLGLALAVSGLSLSGCGGSNPTNRTNSDDLVSTPVKDMVKLTLQSPVHLTNVEARVIDPQSGRVLHQGIIANDHRLIIELPRVDLPAQRPIYIELRPSTLNQSSYYDPIVGKTAVFGSTLRALVQSSGNTQTILIDPYTEIAFQRAQVRSGWLTNRNDISQLGLITQNSLTAATSEVGAVFTVRSTLLPYGISNENDLKKLSVVANQTNELDYFRFALGHVRHFVDKIGSNSAPYLAFSQKAALDMLDGDLDGMTLHGFGDQASILLANPLVQPIANNNPTRNQLELLAVDQATARSIYNLAVGDSIKAFFNPLFLAGSAEFRVINEYDYLNMATRFVANSSRPFGLHSTGAGNYTRAFGLTDNKVIENELNADDTGLISDIEQIAGFYQNAQGCRLEIRPNGRVVLSQGNQRFESDINRNLNDSMSRDSASSQAYLLNITTPSESTPSFLQIRTQGATVLFAQHGRSVLDNPSTDQLSTVDLSCNF